MRKLNRVMILALLAMFSGAAGANVSLKNGNFFIGYTDVSYPGGFEPKIERVYNSKSSYKGLFGWGWGTEFEVYLTVSADGSVVVSEYGGGAQNRFSPTSFNMVELDKAVDHIADVAMKAGGMGSVAQVAEYKRKLKTDAVFRNDQWQKFLEQGKIMPRELKEGTQLQSNRFSYQYITKTKDGYTRVFDSGKVEYFTNSGKLSQVTDRNGNFMKFEYEKDGKLKTLVDNFNRKLFFSYGNQGFLDKITGENGKTATYQFNSLGELTYSKDAEGNVYTYKYSDDKRHNLVEIGYPDKTKQVITYYGRDKQENTKSVKDRDGTLTEYTYNKNSGDRGNFSIGIKITDTNGKTISQSSYEYFMKYKQTGEEWTYRMISSVDGEKTETTYNECCGLPLIIKRGKDETLFEYDQKGRVTKKVTPYESTLLSYDPKFGKVTRVEKHLKATAAGAKGKGAEKRWSEFQYDSKGNLLFAKNSEKQGVRLFYDANGRISSMVDQNKRQIDFKYNENSKPVEIRDPAKGAIKVSYTNSGEIKNVESSAGRAIAVEVTSAFQNLLEIIRPAGVSLSF